MTSMTRPLKVGLVTTVGRNVGDEFIREGVLAILDQVADGYQPLYIDKHDPSSLSRPFYGELNRYGDKYFESDLVIQCGAPVYWHFFGGRARSVDSEWHHWLWRDRVLNAAVQRHPFFLNLGAGSCQPWGDAGDSFVADPECAEFARLLSDRAELTSVRDPVAAGMLESMKLRSLELPCPAFLAACRFGSGRPGHGSIALNLMPDAGHFELDALLDAARWRDQAQLIAERLRQVGPIVFVAHDKSEARFMATMVKGSERVVLSRSWQDYLDLYSGCRLVVANRVHGAVAAAGFGVPVVIVGNDSRSLIGRYLGVPVMRAAGAPADSILDEASRLIRARKAESERLLALRRDTLDRYVRALSSCKPFSNGAENPEPQPGYATLDRNKGFFHRVVDRHEAGDLPSPEWHRSLADSMESGSSFEIDFSASARLPDGVSLKGFSARESWGVWSDARLDRICAVEFEDPLPVSVKVDIVAQGFGANCGETIEVRAGTFKGFVTLGAQPGAATLRIETDGLVHRIEFVVPYPGRPRESRGEDPRLMGIGLRTLTISPIHDEAQGDVA